MSRFIIVLIIIQAFACAQSEQVLEVDLTSDLVSIKHYIIAKSSETISIDGRPDESAWQSAPFTDHFIDIEGIKTPKFSTQAKMLWDDDYLYIYARLEEPNIWGNLRQRDTVIFHNNDFEVFISPSASTHCYGEIEINALGTVWDLYLDKPYRDGGRANNHWNLNGLKSAIFIDGTLNNPSDTDSFWAVEMAIPMKALIELKNRPKTLPKEGEQWRLNFSRVQWDFELQRGRYQRKKTSDGSLQNEYNWVWSNQKVIDMHQPEKWGIIQFTESPSTAKITFQEDNELIISQLAYALFRRTKRGNLKYLLETESGSTQTLQLKYSDSPLISAEFHRTNFGFEYKIPSPYSEQSFLINESGTLKRIP